MTNQSNTNQPANKEAPANLKDPKNPTPAEANNPSKEAAPADGNKAEACSTDKGSCATDAPADKKAAA